MCRRIIGLGLAALAVAGLLAVPGQGHAQMFTTTVVSTPLGFTFYTFPAQWGSGYVGAAPWGSAGMAPAARNAPSVPPVEKIPAPSPVQPTKPKTTSDRTAVINIQVPADATVWLEGRRMKQRGTSRCFQSPPLEPGKTYQYNVRISWRENGRSVTTTRQLTVQAGAQQSLMVLGESNAVRDLALGK